MRRIAVLVTMTLACIAVPAAALSPGETVLVNRAPDGSHQAGGIASQVSGDGRCVLFVAESAALPGFNGVPQVYVRDTVANTTTLVSATPGGAGGDGESSGWDISPDCRWVAFDSESTNLVSPSVTGRHVYRRDLQSNTTLLISRADGAAGALADQGSFSASISDDGDRMAFVSAASNLVADDGNGTLHWDLFVRDVSSADTIHASRSSADVPMETGGGVGFYPSISGDGTRVAFTSPADNLSPDDNDGDSTDVFVKNLTSGVLTLVSRASGASGAPVGAPGGFLSEISGDGSRVLFVSSATNMPGANGQQQVYLRDLGTAETLLVSRVPGGPAGNGSSGNSQAMGLSADGTRAGFASTASNLPDGGGDGITSDVFVHDLEAGTVQMVARASNGTPAANSFGGLLSADGTHVEFVTTSNLASDDTDNQNDLYLRGLGGSSNPPPTPPPVGGGGGPAPAPPATLPKATLRGDAAFVRGTANDLYLACTTLDLYLIDVLPAGRRVAVTGAADLRLVGQTVQILLDGKRVGTAVVRPDGSFAARVAAPARRKRARARYQARVGATASQRLRLERRMVATTLTRSGSNLVLRGVVNPPRARRQPAIAVDRFLSCRRRESVKVTRVKPDRRGRFAVRIKVPSGAQAALYRARTKVPARKGRPATKGTFTLPRAANVG
jgi:Tol biopolymer transport system component